MDIPHAPRGSDFLHNLNHFFEEWISHGAEIEPLCLSEAGSTEWMEEASYKPVDGQLPVSKRQQKKGLGPSVYISAFNSIEALEIGRAHV